MLEAYLTVTLVIWLSVTLFTLILGVNMWFNPDDIENSIDLLEIVWVFFIIVQITLSIITFILL